jgi:hypothetical protein
VTGDGAPGPPAEARRLDPMEIAWETARRRFCDEGCGEEVRIALATWQPGWGMSRRVIFLLCERHGQHQAGLRGICVPPPDAGEPPRGES